MKLLWIAFAVLVVAIIAAYFWHQTRKEHFRTRAPPLTSAVRATAKIQEQKNQ